jgi:enterochelin esterase-like enzyme
MNKYRCYFVIIVLLAATVCPQPITNAQEEDLDSPRLAALAKDILAGKQDALTAFWEEMKGKAPLIEPVSGNDKMRWVSYIWRGDGATQRMGMIGGLPGGDSFIPGGDFRIKPLARLGATDLWYRTERLPVDARFTYTFLHNYVKPAPGEKVEEMVQKMINHARRDPFNPAAFPPGSIAAIAELPAAPPQPWLKPNPAATRGEFKAEKFKSAVLNEERSLQIYTPPGYNANGKPYPLLIFLDGEAAPLAIPLPVILDNLTASGKIPPLMAVTIASGATRMRDLLCSANFADFIAKELVPGLRNRYAITADPQQTVISGFSAGGLAAAWVAMRHPQVVGAVLSQSGGFWFYEGWTATSPEPAFIETGWLTRQYASTPRLPLRFYLEVGSLEQSVFLNLVLENRRLRDTLTARGYPVTYSEYNGGHDALCWRGSIADGLIALLGAPQKGK